MPRFTTAPIGDVVPKRKQRHPSVRAQIQREYRQALETALQSSDQALVVELDPQDKPLTIRNRIRRAAQQLQVDDLTVRRRGNRIVAYRAAEND
jgi:hypothetical protein